MWVRVCIGGGYTNLIDFRVVGHWVRKGVFFVPSFVLFACFTCTGLVYSCTLFALFLIQFLTYQYVCMYVCMYVCLCVCVYHMNMHIFLFYLFLNT